MAFEPLGYHFEVRCDKAPAVVKAMLRGKMKSWFDPKTGARGWIVGPFLCLWQSAFDQYGPMVLARIKSDVRGTIIAGRAGADLNGSLWSMLAFSTFLLAMAMAVIKGQASIGGALILVLVISLFLSLTLWWGHKDRKDAEGLVRFVQRTLGSEPELRARSARAARAIKHAGASEVPVSGATLIIDGVKTETNPSPADMIDAVDQLYPDDGFAIVEFSDHCYMQAAETGNGFCLEYRDGGPDRHFRATGTIDREGVAIAMLHYLATREAHPEMKWELVCV
jgi:hypothetical protein